MAKKSDKKSDVYADRHEEVGGLTYEQQMGLGRLMRNGTLPVDRVGLEFFPEEDKKEAK
jgi:hypothetical protein